MLAGLTAHADTLSGPEREAVEQFIETQRAKGPDTTGTDSEAEAFRQVLSEMGVKEKLQPLRSTTVAGKTGQKEDFDPLFRACSKLMHRTALSISAENQKGSLDAIVPLLKTSALGDLATISTRIKEHIETVGIKPISSE